MTIQKRYAIVFILLFMVELFIALFIRDTFIRPFVGDALVVILIYFLIRIFFTPKTIFLPLYIFIFALMVEFGQFFNILSIINLENNQFARIIFGATFDIKDIISYFAGCLILMLWQKAKKKTEKKTV